MTESTKRTILVCAFGWLLGGRNALEYAMAAGIAVLFTLRLCLFHENGDPR